jgi:hypothetical protein
MRGEKALSLQVFFAMLGNNDPALREVMRADP